MSDKEKVINSIKYCINHPLCIDCNACNYGGETSVICDRLIQDALALLKEQQQWVSVKDRMPEEHKQVLVIGIEAIGNVRVFSVKVNDRGVWRPTSAPSVVYDYWMPLPELPKEVSE